MKMQIREHTIHSPKTLLTHIGDCELHAESVRSRARVDLAASPKKSARFTQAMPPEPLETHAVLYIESRTPSPAISDVFFMSIPSKCERTTQSGLYRSVSQSTITVSDLSPHVSVHWPTGQPWTDADQTDWEARLA
ncbi:hypothetical protein AZE42_13873 [Rhizopogon vesiculosus]|uniref:Uncharacterized protein n=1 Tax=Rhizopogon vesiculosus TaxID=180088 RepID=A0A1J8R1V2_9AGAM|nr:hypothetical protein AZE42_13873 [Rhizopogon vesiculosus]